MRIIAGEWRGRRIAAPAGMAVRPTLDRVREAWMSMVHSALPGSRVLDLYAGSGALGLEALSRGAERTDFVEHEPAAFRALLENVRTLGASDRCALHRQDAVAFLAACDGKPYDVAFADPPYRLGLAVQLADRWLNQPFAAIFGVEHESSATLPQGGNTRKYGHSSVTIFRT